jgi:hypothetical protein
VSSSNAHRGPQKHRSRHRNYDRGTPIAVRGKKASFDKRKCWTYLSTTLRGLAKFLSRRDSSERARFRPQAEERARIPECWRARWGEPNVRRWNEARPKSKVKYRYNKMGPHTAGPRDVKVLYQPIKWELGPSHFGNAATVLRPPDHSLSREAQTATKG